MKLPFFAWLGVLWNATAGQDDMHKRLEGEAAFVTLLCWSIELCREFRKNTAILSSVFIGLLPGFKFNGGSLMFAFLLFSLLVQASAVQYSFTGASQTITVPSGAITMVATLYGGAGGATIEPGGRGGKIAAKIPVSSGQTYYLHVGGAANGFTAGWNGGGAGYGSLSGGGGGATDLRTSGNSLNDRILVAGGGGGASNGCGRSGGGGGYPSGLTGPQCNSYPVGVPGTATAGGFIAYTFCGTVNNGGFGLGGNACLNGGACYGGAGGGGWYGGSGSYASPGGGGSGYSLYAVTSSSNAVNGGNGYATIDYIFAPPTHAPTCFPTSQPSNSPTGQPSVHPSGQPTRQPTHQPTSQPTSKPSMQPSLQPSRQPTRQPTDQPSGSPSTQPFSQPSRSPTSQPSGSPTRQPSGQPSGHPTAQPSASPTAQPSGQPTGGPTKQPSAQPSSSPSGQPSSQPSVSPSAQPSVSPTAQPFSQPSAGPTGQPSCQPSRQPSDQPSSSPSSQPTSQPSGVPSVQPSAQPSQQPTAQPSNQPSGQPSAQPSAQPSGVPSTQPSSKPSSVPTGQPSTQPSQQPTAFPSTQSTSQPSGIPSGQPSVQPSTQPSQQPTAQPSSVPTGQPSSQPTQLPSTQPTSCPSVRPTSQPSTHPSSQPTSQPSGQPSIQPSAQPSGEPSSQPTHQPSSQPTSQPSGQPSIQPSAQPSGEPSSQPSAVPSTQPSSVPTSQPSSQPSGEPTAQPSGKPTSQPAALPSAQPTGQPTVSSVGVWVTDIENTQNIKMLTVVDSHVWACGGRTVSAVCTAIDVLTGLALPTYSFSWDEVTSVIPILNSHRVIVSGISINTKNEASSEMADCVLDTGLRCTIQSIADTSFSAGMYVPYPDVFVYIGASHAHTSVAIIDPAANKTWSYVYKSPLIEVLELSHLQSLPNYVGGLVAGTGVTTFGARNCIIAGLMRTERGQMTAIYLTPIVGYIINTVNLVNTLVAEITRPDSFIAGGLQMSSVEGMHAYLVRVNVLYRTVLYGMRYVRRSENGANRRLQESVRSDSVVQKIIFVENSLYMMVNVPSPELFATINKGSVSILKTDETSGRIIHQVNVYSFIASIQSSDIVSTGAYLAIACNVRYAANITETLVISVDRDLTFKMLPVGFIADNNKSFTAESVAFHRTSLPLIAEKDNTAIYSYQLNTSEVVSTRLVSVMPSLVPSSAPSPQPSSSPTAAPSVSPQPTSQPSTSGPTNTYKPTVKPTQRPSTAPSRVPTVWPTESPTATPTTQPTEPPSAKPTLKPSVVLTLPPRIAPTAKPTKVKPVAPTVSKTLVPTALVVSVSGHAEEDSNSILLILVYIVAGLVVLWCLHRLRRYFVQLREDREKEEIVRKYFETVQSKASDSIKARKSLHGASRLDAPVKFNTCQAGAHAQKEPHWRIVQNLASQYSVVSEESASLIVSSLHSSEISYAGSSGFSGSSVDQEESWYEGTHRSQSSPSTFKSLSMEEGRANSAEGESMYDGSSSSSGSSNEFESRSGSQSLVNSCDT